MRVNLAHLNLDTHTGTATDFRAPCDWWYGITVVDQQGNRVNYDEQTRIINISPPPDTDPPTIIPLDPDAGDGIVIGSIITILD